MRQGLRTLRGLIGLRGVEGGKGVEGVEGVEGADVAAIYTYSHMVRAPLGIGYIALWGLGAKFLSG